MTTIARTARLLLVTVALAGVGCGQQDESHTNTGPVTDENPGAPTPATAPESRSAAEASPSGPAPAKLAPAADQPTAPTTEGAGVPAKSAATPDGKVELEKVSYNAFLKRVAENPTKARFTMVDAWATWCGPCKENFSHVVQMHQKYADKGLAVASLSFDDPAESKQVEDARSFLLEKKAFFPNYLLDEEFGAGFEKFGVNSIPAVFIYGPDGKEVKRFSWDDPNKQFTYDEVEQAVAALLDGKS
jgi:thiol-disulfide isomerase/thioredoxin